MSDASSTASAHWSCVAGAVPSGQTLGAPPSHVVSHMPGVDGGGGDGAGGGGDGWGGGGDGGGSAGGGGAGGGDGGGGTGGGGDGGGGGVDGGGIAGGGTDGGGEGGLGQKAISHGPAASAAASVYLMVDDGVGKTIVSVGDGSTSSDMPSLIGSTRCVDAQ